MPTRASPCRALLPLINQSPPPLQQMRMWSLPFGPMMSRRPGIGSRCLLGTALPFYTLRSSRPPQDRKLYSESVPSVTPTNCCRCSLEVSYGRRRWVTGSGGRTGLHIPSSTGEPFSGLGHVPASHRQAWSFGIPGERSASGVPQDVRHP